MRARSRIRLLAPLLVLTGLVALLLVMAARRSSLLRAAAAYGDGSSSCIPCHEDFYRLWHDSRHGLAMQPVTPEFIRRNIRSDGGKVKVADALWEAQVAGDSLIFTEWDDSGTAARYAALHVLGGKYLYYFLTPFPGGRLQVLPLAYDCSSDEWYGTTGSSVRHFESGGDAPLDWRSHLYTFNTSCHSCHVSQLETNYNPVANSYNTTWGEPGINCETCHGPGHDHIVASLRAGEGRVPRNLRIVRTGLFTAEQHNSACGSCHAKASVIAPDFPPGGLFYDYFDLVTLENPDYYADGRDLGENYTMTGWEMNRCAAAGSLHCVDCHTSGGRYRFSAENANDACLPCHSDKVSAVAAHSLHDAGSEGSRCVACHMPKSTFARMERSDHSFRPPVPRATLLFGSPNACNLCHSDRTAGWADEVVSERRRPGYQEEALADGRLLKMAREGDWSALELILGGLAEGRFDNVYATSFIRLLEGCDDPSRWEVLRRLTGHPSPLVRGAAAHSLHGDGSPEARERLLTLAGDSYRLVRINAAYALSGAPMKGLCRAERRRAEAALREYEASLTAQPDSWSAYYNLGLWHSNRGDYKKALAAYSRSVMLYPEAVMPLVNAGVIYYTVMDDVRQARELFTGALAADPRHEAALTNMALLCGEAGEYALAEKYYRQLLEVSERNAVAAYNLAVLIAPRDPDGAVSLSRRAMEWDRNNPKYARSCAYYLLERGDAAEAEEILSGTVARFPGYFDSYPLLADLLMKRGEAAKAAELLAAAARIEELTPGQKRVLAEQLALIRSSMEGR